jgi:hypothetical protein
MADSEEQAVPKSNVDEIANDLVLRTIHLTGEGFVDVIELLLKRAKDIKSLNERAATFDRQLLSGKLPNQEEVNAELLDAIYDPLCLRLLIARVMRALSDHEEFTVIEHMQKVRPVSEINFRPDGQIDSYRLSAD